VTVGSLFSGIGGFDLGLERAGMTVRWQVEKDAWCRRVLAKHWPDVPRYEKVEDVGDELEPVDLICGGFPCQPVSVAGHQKGTSDDRWLWPEFRRIVGILRPRYVLMENVPGLFTANRGHAFGEILGDLADLGYDCEWTVLSAADVGAPHLRKRVWIVADADADRRDPKSDGQGRESRSSFGSTVALGERRVDQRRRLGQEPGVADAEGEPERSRLRQSQPGRQRGRRPGDIRGSLADAESNRRRPGRPRGSHPRRQGKPEYALQTVADADRPGREEQRGTKPVGAELALAERRGPEMADADHEGQSSRTVYAIEGTSLSEFTSSHQWWRTEPDVGRVAHGVPRRVDRLRGLGNAIVPRCAEEVARRLLFA
jgi:DNA (cytosine-5)-methyltransferase 1